MLAQERQAVIVDMLKVKKIVKISEIAEHFGISNLTARRDLEALESQQILKRIYGGGMLLDVNAAVPERAQEMQEIEQSNELRRWKAAADLVQPGETIILSFGTNTLGIAKQLAHRSDITVLTASLPIVNVLADSKINLYVLGGHFNADERCMVGGLTMRALDNFHVDKAFMGIGGISLEAGITDFEYNVAEMNRAIMQHSAQNIFVVCKDMFGINSFSIVCPIDKADLIITDEGLAPEYVNGLRERNVRVLMAPAAPGPATDK